MPLTSLRRVFDQPRSSFLLLIAALLGGCATPPLHREAGRVPDAVDFTTVDAFWRVQASLSAGREPSVEEWQQLLVTPGYRLARRVYGDELQEDLRLAFLPSRQSASDSVMRLGRDRGLRLMHLRQAVALRPRLQAFRDSVIRSALASRALSITASFLPPGATDHGDPPPVVFAIFADEMSAKAMEVIERLERRYWFRNHRLHLPAAQRIIRSDA